MNPTPTPAQTVPPADTAPLHPAAEVATPIQQPKKVQPSIAGSTWVSLIIGALLLVLLIVFILQNQQPATIVFLGLEATLPLGAGLLLAAITGALIMACVGGIRILQLRRQVRR